MSNGSSYICVTVYYHLKHQPMVTMATEQHMAYNIAQTRKNIFCLVHVCILNMIDWSQEGFLESSFAFLLPLHFVEPACCETDIVVTTSVQGMWVRCVYVQICPSITCAFMHRFQNNLAQLFSLTSKSVIETFV